MANHSPATFGALLKRFRREALLTQEQLATRAQLSPDTIRALESGKRRTPRPDTIRLLAEALALEGAEREALLASATLPDTATDTENRPLVVRTAAVGSVQPNPLVGRESELATIRQRLTRESGKDVEHARLLTLTGPAGVGKTRLALAAMEQITDYFSDGAVFVDLTPVHDPMLALSTVARAVGLADISSQTLLDRVCDYLQGRMILLTIDNFEQALPAAGILADMLVRLPDLTLLVTSRVPLRLRWEWTLRVPPLAVPDMDAPLPPLETLKVIPSVALFMERARARQADFALSTAHAPLIARLTSELDGLPLAIELAAARLDAFPLPTLLHRLNDRLRFLRWEAADLPERQRSLEAAVGWSYDLLSGPDKRLFRNLGVFVGQITLPAITSVIAARLVSEVDMEGVRSISGEGITKREKEEGHTLEGMASLVEKSLALPASLHRLERVQLYRQEGVQDNQGGYSEQDSEMQNGEDADSVFTVLETVREYAWEQLERLGELEEARRAHAHYFLQFAEQADPHLRSRDQHIWYAHLERELKNLRAALRWLLSQEGADAVAEREAGLGLAVALGWFWWTQGYISEGVRWLEEALERTLKTNDDSGIRARALCEAGTMLAYQGKFERAKTLLEEAVALAQRYQDRALIAQTLSYLGLCAVYSGDVAASVPLLREALRLGRDINEPHQVGMTLMYLGAATFALNDFEQAAIIYTESLAHFETAGDMIFSVNIQLNLGWLALRQGHLSHAIERIRNGLKASVILGNRRLLSLAAQSALSLVTALDEVVDADENGHLADLTQRARLLGAIDTLNQTTGMTLLQKMMKTNMGELREHIQRAGLDVAYREGRSLPFSAVVALALTQVEALDMTLLQTMRKTTIEHEMSPRYSQTHQPQNTPLSNREDEILRLVAQGLSSKAIAQQLLLSPSTINYHLISIFNKLGADTRAQAVAVAAQRGIL